MKLIPCADRMVCKPIIAKKVETTKSGIFKVEAPVTTCFKKIVSIGPDCKIFNEGDIVMVGVHSGVAYTCEDVELRILREADVICSVAEFEEEPK